MPVAANPPGAEPQALSRNERADHYFEADLAGQRRWYGERATRLKSRANALGLAVIALGAGTTFCQAFGQAPWVQLVTALLGALVAVAEGWRQVSRYDETWAAYRAASERMKRERRLYTNGAAAYSRAGDEDSLFKQFVEAIETIIAEEQQIYWRDRGSSPTSPKQPPAGG